MPVEALRTHFMQYALKRLQPEKDAPLAAPLRSIMAAPDVTRYLARKREEIALLDACLDEPLTLPEPRSVQDAIDVKLKLAAALRARTSLHSWAITETARPDVGQWQTGAYRLSFAYQRADLDVDGPPIYPVLDAHAKGCAVETLYTTSGMSAIAVLVHALVHVHGHLEVHAHRGGYGETRELLERFRDRVHFAPLTRRRNAPPAVGARIVFLDSVAGGLPQRDDPLPRDTAMIVCDTTCWWQESGRIARVVRWARRHDVPLALIRSHAKLDGLGIEYGRLGSIVFSWRRAGVRLRDLVHAARDTVRLIGAAPVPAHFPPFTGTDAYRRISARRTAAIIKATRRLRDALRDTALAPGLGMYTHGLYLTIALGGDLRVKDVKRAVDALCEALIGQGLPVRHAGSFGFDFVALEWFPDPSTRRNVIRIAPGDLPVSVMDRVADGIVRWFSLQTAALGTTDK